MITVTIRSWLNFDGFDCNGKSYRLDELDKLKEVIGNQEVNFVRGKNTFTGKPVSDKFYESMRNKLKGALYG